MKIFSRSILPVILFIISTQFIIASPPDWEDNPSGYEFTATISGGIILNDEEQLGDDGDLFAAFDDAGNVRGIALQLSPPFGPYQGTPVFEMQMRSNDAGDLLSFKYYDASEDAILDVVETYEFVINDIIGDVTDPWIMNIGSSGGENEPDWEDNPSGYEFTATISGAVILNDGVQMGDDGDIFAAFDDEDNNRGIALMLSPPFGTYQGTPVFEMQMRSNAGGDHLTFKYYDASEDAVLDISEDYTFVINDIIGDVTDPWIMNIGSGDEECIDDDASVSAFGGCGVSIAAVGCDFNFPFGSDTYIYDFCPVSCNDCPVVCENDDEAVAAFGGCGSSVAAVGCDFNFPWGSDTYIYDFCPIDCLEECASGDVEGCMDDTACNYNADAAADDGSCLQDDCAGVCGGSSVLSGCDSACNSTAVVDCAGSCGGSSVLSGCDNACNSTAVNDCAGVCGGSSVADCAGVCGGSSVADCAGVCGGDALSDNCGTCDSDSSNDCTQDCAGSWGGSAVADNCGSCDSDSSNDCTQDCNGAWGGTAWNSDCGCVAADNDGNDCDDCAGTPNGSALEDNCNVCDTDSSNDCTQDCAGTWGGTAVADECGQCGGSGPAENFTCDGFKPTATAVLQTAVDLWVSDNATALATYGEINSWDVSLITDMSELFKDKTTFNDNIGSWDVSSVTDMEHMFHNASTFNGDLSSWDVSNVTNMGHMFRYAAAFNQDLFDWDVSKVTNMYTMFSGASSFSGDISSWDVSSVTQMAEMFRDAGNFNGDISSWDVSSVTQMYRDQNSCDHPW